MCESYADDAVRRCRAGVGVVPAVGGEGEGILGVLSEREVGSGIKDVLGWAVAETIGKLVFSLVVDEGSGRRVMEEGVNRGGDEIMKVRCGMVGNDGRRRPVDIFHVNDRQPVRLPSKSSKLKLGGYCHSGYPLLARYRRV